MSLRNEQHRSLKMARKLLRDLIRPSESPNVPKYIRERAMRCLHHYPFLEETGKPMFSQDDFGD